MKDNFDLRKYLVENKMTMNSRKTRKPLGPVVLNEKVLGPVEETSSEGSEPTGAKGQFLDMLGYTKDYSFTVAGHRVDADEEWGAWDRPNYNTVKIDGKPLGQYSDDDPIFSEINPAMKDFINYEDYKLDYGEDKPLDEAGYTDFDDEDNYEKDLDFSAGDSIVSKIGGKNRKAKRAAEKEMDTFDEPEADDTDVSFEDPEDMDDSSVEKSVQGQTLDIKYDPETVDMWMDDEELQDYLQSYRRPQVAAKVLQRAINQAQEEVDNSPGISKLYLYLKNGFYHTGRFQKPGATIIAQVFSKEKASKKKGI